MIFRRRGGRRGADLIYFFCTDKISRSFRIDRYACAIHEDEPSEIQYMLFIEIGQYQLKDGREFVCLCATMYSALLEDILDAHDSDDFTAAIIGYAI